MLRLVVGFLPWIILGVLGNHWFVPALVLALAAATVTTTRQIISRSLKILDTTTFAFFLFVAIGVIGFRWMILATYMSLLVNVTLTAIAWGSLVAGMPFTIQYAREQVAPEFWHSPVFIRINQYITAVWGLDFFLSTLVTVYRQVSGDRSLTSQYPGCLFVGRCALHGLILGLVPGPRLHALKNATPIVKLAAFNGTTGGCGCGPGWVTSCPGGCCRCVPCW